MARLLGFIQWKLGFVGNEEGWDRQYREVAHTLFFCENGWEQVGQGYIDQNGYNNMVFIVFACHQVFSVDVARRTSFFRFNRLLLVLVAVPSPSGSHRESF